MYRYGINNCTVNPPYVCKGSALYKPSAHDTHMNGAEEIINNGLGSRATYIGILSLNVLISV
jgi:hypothetical protein